MARRPPHRRGAALILAILMLVGMTGLGMLAVTTSQMEVKVAGSSIKFCLVAEAEADIYPRYGHTHEWDTAAGHAVLRAAGGSVRTLDGEELAYGKPAYHNPEFIARGRDG